ncbi:urease accessory protein UreF [Denitromonas iodatirespirans]|uniref:Urease accessory protein UreF n=1 Tax=Denitromonas iodatirespirans TaxID=2795389 RepID=A0A944DNB4_DENI1|nr:urease accessory UreF family protein [Denitromonas iodatirespirans]MBT0961774.1 urease accessory protein UreF [Denitromonas iodatirespirans]
MSLARIRLLQLTSPTLPVGAFTYSQGLEWAAEAGTVSDETSAGDWIGGLMHGALARFEGPLAAALLAAWNSDDDERVASLNDLFLASRETAELRAETEQMGYSLTRLLRDLPAFRAAPGRVERLAALDTPSYPAAWTAAASAWQIPVGEALPAYFWAWLENQVMAAIKVVPLGQSAGQRLLSRLGDDIPALADTALTLPDDAWSNFTPGLALASSQHETQYSRLFRS